MTLASQKLGLFNLVDDASSDLALCVLSITLSPCSQYNYRGHTWLREFLISQQADLDFANTFTHGFL